MLIRPPQAGASSQDIVMRASLCRYRISHQGSPYLLPLEPSALCCPNQTLSPCCRLLMIMGYQINFLIEPRSSIKICAGLLLCRHSPNHWISWVWPEAKIQRKLVQKRMLKADLLRELWTKLSLMAAKPFRTQWMS